MKDLKKKKWTLEFDLVSKEGATSHRFAVNGDGEPRVFTGVTASEVLCMYFDALQMHCHNTHGKERKIMEFSNGTSVKVSGVKGDDVVYMKNFKVEEVSNGRKTKKKG